MYDDLTVAENLRFFARVLGVGRGRGRRVLEAVDLGVARATRWSAGSAAGSGRASASPSRCSASPTLLVLDEPTVGLDPVLRRDLWELFHRLADAGAAVLVSSHVMDEADRCDRLLLMREGRIIADGSPADIRQRDRRADIEAAFLRWSTVRAGPAMSPADHPRRRRPRARAAAPRPPHAGDAAGRSRAS